MKSLNKSFLLFLLCWLTTEVFGQQAAIKTNLLYWTLGTPNLGIEIATGEKHSISLAGGFLPWQYSDSKKLKHWLVQPEFRYWPCETFNGHFWGIHALGGQFNAGGVSLLFGIFPTLKDNRYQGWLGEACDAAILAQTRKIRLAAGQQLMNIRLMANIENQAVLHGIVNRLNGDAQFNGTQITGQMASGFGYIVNQEFPDFPAKLSPFLIGQLQQIVTSFDSL